MSHRVIRYMSSGASGGDGTFEAWTPRAGVTWRSAYYAFFETDAFCQPTNTPNIRGTIKLLVDGVNYAEFMWARVFWGRSPSQSVVLPFGDGVTFTGAQTLTGTTTNINAANSARIHTTTWIGSES